MLFFIDAHGIRINADLIQGYRRLEANANQTTIVYDGKTTLVNVSPQAFDRFMAQTGEGGAAGVYEAANGEMVYAS